jgi:hypothetical protein
VAREVVLRALEYRDVPWSQALESGQTIMTSTPPFSLFLNHLDRSLDIPDPSALADLEASRLIPTKPAVQQRFDLEIEIDDHAKEASARLLYRNDLFEVATSRRVLRDYFAVLDAFASHPDQAIDS